MPHLYNVVSKWKIYKMQLILCLSKINTKTRLWMAVGAMAVAKGLEHLSEKAVFNWMPLSHHYFIHVSSTSLGETDP